MNGNLSYNEKDLLLQVSEGNEHAFRQLFDTYRSKLYTYILKITESKEMAEDTVHDVFLKIWTQKEKLPEILNLNAYLYRMAHNHAYNGLRKMAKETLVMAELAKNGPGTIHYDLNETLVRKEVRQFIKDAVNGLTPQQKEVFTMSKELGLKQEEIAQRLGISISTVKKHHTDAMNYLRKTIARSYGSRAVAIYVLFYLAI
ncbi:MAG: RNA polymerase sigma-70 factor [Chitinophagaceae bacterium]